MPSRSGGRGVFRCAARMRAANSSLSVSSHESVDAAANHRLERLAHHRREACVGVQDVAATREDERTFLHLFDEVAVPGSSALCSV